MTRILVTYVDELGDVGAAAEAPHERDASSEAWQSLIGRYGPDVALSRFRQVVQQLPAHATVRYVVQRASTTEPRQVCAYGKHKTARVAVDALAGTTDHVYVVVIEVRS